MFGNKPKDLTPEVFPTIDWTQSAHLRDLENVYDYVTGRAQKAIQWYYDERQGKRRWGFLFRYLAIFFTALGGIIPVVVAMLDDTGLKDAWWNTPTWSTIALALAALMITFDKFGGFSTSWIRYILAAQDIDNKLETFRFDWQIQRADLSDPIAIAEARTMMETCRDFMMQVNDIIRNETQKWVSEFQAALRQVDEAAREASKAAESRARAQQRGALEIEVTNGDRCTDGWTLAINRTPHRFTGKYGSVADLKPGVISFEVTGTIDGDPKQTSRSATIVGGKVARHTIVLE